MACIPLFPQWATLNGKNNPYSMNVSNTMNEKNMISMVILSNGNFPTHNIPLEALRSASKVVCCDGAIYSFCQWVEKEHSLEENSMEGTTMRERKITVNERNTDGTIMGGKEITIVGDGDSFNTDKLTLLQQRLSQYNYSLTFHGDSNQENNDLTKAVQYAIAQGAQQLTIVGATGLREDHTLGNISLLTCYVQLASVQMLTDYGIFTPISCTTHFSSFERQQVSLFSLTPQVTISATGLQYPVEHRCFRQWWEGTLNAALGETFTIEIESSKPCANADTMDVPAEILVFQTYEPKEVKVQ